MTQHDDELAALLKRAAKHEELREICGYGAHLGVGGKALAEVLDTVRDLAARLRAGQGEPVAWRCFHCHAEFVTDAEAEEHFGAKRVFTTPTPACLIDVARVRQLENIAATLAEALDGTEDRDDEGALIPADDYQALCALFTDCLELPPPPQQPEKSK